MEMFRGLKFGRNSNANQKQSPLVGRVERSVKPTAPPAPSVDVFQNHWRQALAVIKRTSSDSTRTLTNDDVTAVVQYVEKMSGILEMEVEENGQQGHCLVYLLAEDILQQLVTWCLQSGVYENKIKYELLKILENLISQSRQPLLYHKPVIKPLLCLLGSCMNTSLPEIENHVILLLHQLCVCISRNPQRDEVMCGEMYLELFFNVSYSSGQDNFLIFCLLIPYIHREGTVGQQARDALLLIMAASARNQVIGKYIASNSDFCPVLATGLSALYSSLPHKVRPEGHEDWYRIEKEHYLDMPDVQMIINCLEFCNAVVQVAHVLVGQQLIDYIYNGFLLPVMAPALLQSTIIEEQVSAIAYLELFVRTITEPSLLRAFLHFILTAKHDDVVILEWLIERINSSTKLCMVSLSLFKTLIELNCEDVMFGLCFKYLYRLNHVMQSQRRAIKQVDMYGSIAEKIIQLEPDCCQVTLSEEQHKLLISYNDGIFSSSHTPNTNPLEDYKSSYMDYLSQARAMIISCSQSCNKWCFVYDGEIPPSNASLESLPKKRAGRSNSLGSAHKYDTPDPSLEDDVPLISLEMNMFTPARKQKTASAPPPTNDQADDSLLIDISTDSPVDGASSRAESSPPLLADDVPLCIGGEPSADSQCDVVIDEPLLALDQQQDSTLSLLINTQNQAISCSVSPPVVDSFSSSQLLSSTPTMSSAHLDSFLSYLDDSINHVSVDPDKSGPQLFEEVDSLIEEAEQNARKRKESQSSAEEAIAKLNISLSSAAGLASERVDAGPSLFVDPRPRRKLPADYSLSLDDSIDPTPSIGPFLTMLLSKLENMMNNSLSVNLLLTGLVTRIASYPQPILRSFLLNHSLVFHPSIKSLVQVLGSVRIKIDIFARKVSNFNVLLLQARKLMLERADKMDAEMDSLEARHRSASVMGQAADREVDKSPGKMLSGLFRRDKQTKQAIQPELVLESQGYRFTSSKQAGKVKYETTEARLATINTKKAVYSALVLEEFVKELAALSQEHAVHSDEGYQTD